MTHRININDGMFIHIANENGLPFLAFNVMEIGSQRQIRQQILDDHEKAKKWDKFLKLYGVVSGIEPEEIIDYIIKIRNEKTEIPKEILENTDDTSKAITIGDIENYHKVSMNQITNALKLEQLVEELLDSKIEKVVGGAIVRKFITTRELQSLLDKARNEK